MANLKKITRGYIYYKVSLKKQINKKKQKRVLNWYIPFNVIKNGNSKQRKSLRKACIFFFRYAIPISFNGNKSSLYDRKRYATKVK